MAASDYSSATQKQFVIDASASYKYYALVVEKIVGGSYASTNPRDIIGEWRLFTETFTVDAGVVSTTAASGLDVGYTEHPVEPMTDFHTYVEGHGTYEASASSQNDLNPSRVSYKAFLKDNTDDFQSDDNWSVSNVYNNSHLTTDVGGTKYYGEWLQLRTPYAFNLSHMTMYVAVYRRAPGNGVILGSNDGEKWYKLTEYSGLLVEYGETLRIDVNATSPYSYYRLVVSALADATATHTKLQVSDARLFAEKPVTRMENVHISGDLSSETLQTGYIKWPKVPLKANESEGYVASQSSSFNSNFIGFHAFEDKSEYTDGGTPSWASGSTSFSSGSAAVSRTTGSDTFYHEWLQIQLPQSIQLS